MKKVLAFLLVAVLVLSMFSFVGCNNDPTDPSITNPNSTSPTNTTKPTTTKPTTTKPTTTKPTTTKPTTTKPTTTKPTTTKPGNICPDCGGIITSNNGSLPPSVGNYCDGNCSGWSD